MEPDKSFRAAFEAVKKLAKDQTAREIFESMCPVRRAPRPTAALVTHTPTATAEVTREEFLRRFQVYSMLNLLEYIRTSGSPFLAEARAIYEERLATGELPAQISRPVPCDAEQPGETEHQNKHC